MHKNQMSLETYEKVSDSFIGSDENSHLPEHIGKLINLSNACRRHNCSMEDYHNAHKIYAKGGNIGDSVIIEDKNSNYFGKIGTIVGEVENTYVIKTINGTGIAKKTRVKLVKSDKDYAKGGSVSNELNIANEGWKHRRKK